MQNKDMFYSNYEIENNFTNLRKDSGGQYSALDDDASLSISVSVE
jgi:hypothetical protein